MSNLIKNLTDLIKVKTIVTIIILCVYATLAMRGDISADNVILITGTVVAFYFGTQSEKK